MGQVVQALSEAQQLRQLIQIPFIRLLFVQKQRHQDVFPGRQHRQKVELLENKAHLPAAEGGQLLVRKCINFLAVIGQAPRGRVVQPGQQMEQGALAAAGWANNGDEIPGSNRQVGLVQGNHLIFAAAINF